jgi:hypothetical protein
MNSVDFNAVYNIRYKKSFAFAKSYVQDDMIAEDLVSKRIVSWLEEDPGHVQEYIKLRKLYNLQIWNTEKVSDRVIWYVGRADPESGTARMARQKVSVSLFRNRQDKESHSETKSEMGIIHGGCSDNLNLLYYSLKK